jgi:putative methionine-R-sulfoxide reductase with GAF domain
MPPVRQRSALALTGKLSSPERPGVAPAFPYLQEISVANRGPPTRELAPRIAISTLRLTFRYNGPLLINAPPEEAAGHRAQPAAAARDGRNEASAYRPRGAIAASYSLRPKFDRSAERGALIADIAGIVTRSHDLRETLHNVTDLVAKRLDADVCSVYLTSADRAALTLSATMGLDSASVGIVKLAAGEGLVGHVAARGEAEAFVDAQRHPAYKYFPETKEEQFASLRPRR